MLTKSGFIKYLQCPKALWLYKYRKDLLGEIDKNKQAIFDAGYEVENCACKLFPEGVSAYDDKDDFWAPVNKTRKLIKDRTPVIFQPTFVANKLFCRCDIIKYSPDRKVWDLIEVKSSTQVHDVHYKDLSFQKICLEGAGVKVGKTYLMHINNQYVKNGEIDPKKLLIKQDVSDEIEKIEEDTKIEIKSALRILSLLKEPDVKILRQCHRPYQCDFIDYCMKDVPEDSIYSIAGALGEKKIEELLDEGVLQVADIPKRMLTSKKLERHHYVTKHNTIHKERDSIKEELEKITYPIYYLDYETYSSAIPIFDGYRPYQRIVFQYSLHVQKEQDGEVRHYAFLARDFKDPTFDLSNSLKKNIGKEGTLIAWNKGFEEGCNTEMGERDERFREFYEDINSRMYDLMEVFKKGYYVHKDFHGSASLKKVLPVVAPDLSYNELNIGEGMLASNTWGNVIKSDLSKKEKNKVFDDLLDYCELDTFAMVRILEELKK